MCGSGGWLSMWLSLYSYWWGICVLSTFPQWDTPTMQHSHNAMFPQSNFGPEFPEMGCFMLSLTVCLWSMLGKYRCVMGYSFINYDQECVCSLMSINGALFRNSQLYGIMCEYCSTTLFFGNAIWFLERPGFICKLLYVKLFNIPFTIIWHVKHIPIPHCNILPILPEMLNQNRICYHWPSVSGNS